MVAHRPMPLTLMTHAQLRRLAGDLHRHRVAIQHRMAKIDDAIADVQREISKRDQIEVEVSDHAVVRWLERQKGMDIQAVRNEIANNARGLLGGPEASAVGKVRILLDGATVVTVLPNGEDIARIET
jgi:hypothetical protein